MGADCPRGRARATGVGMAWAALREMSCTLCGISFVIRSGEMVHPADLVCDGCIRSLWDRLDREGAESVEATLAPRPRYGLAPEVIAGQIVRRVIDLKDLVGSRAELELALEHRRR